MAQDLKTGISKSDISINLKIFIINIYSQIRSN